MDRNLEILEAAISDAGYWRWWGESLPDLFQVEFGWVQLWTPPAQSDKPPSGIFALRFESPSVVAFLTEEASAEVPDDWPEQLQNDRIATFNVTYGQFSLDADADISAIKQGCLLRFLVGSEVDLDSGIPDVRLAFRAGPIGLIVCASAFSTVAHEGIFRPAQIPYAYEKWWEYWREYWRRRDGATPLPMDGACEVTIPLGE